MSRSLVVGEEYQSISALRANSKRKTKLVIEAGGKNKAEGTHLEIIQLIRVQDPILVHIAQLEDPSERFHTFRFQSLFGSRPLALSTEPLLNRK